jgi:hypothetical protein
VGQTRFLALERKPSEMFALRSGTCFCRKFTGAPCRPVIQVHEAVVHPASTRASVSLVRDLIEISHTWRT